LPLLAMLILAACGAEGGGAQAVAFGKPMWGEGPSCQNLPEDWSLIYFNVRTTCAEIVYRNVTPPEAAPALMGIAFAPDGTLYLARTARGEIWAIPDTNGDQVMDEPRLFADGLRLPTALAIHDGAVYVVSVGGIVRLEDTDGDGQADTRAVLVDDLPTETGLWPGSIGVGPDGRLYVSTGAACNACSDPDARRGAILSYTLDGGDERIVATGFRKPADFAWNSETGDLWVIDGGRVMPGQALDGPPDELNRVEPGAQYGFPFCYGQRVPDPSQGGDETICAATESPRFTFPYQSNPSGMAFYDSDTFPDYVGSLVVALRGSWDLPEPAGYAVTTVGFADGIPTGKSLNVVPFFAYTKTQPPLSYYSLTGWGLFPYRPADVAISAEGWIYVSLEEGMILRFRPRSLADKPGK
jgi:glucose/arabinose dehydrogenase